MALNKSDYQQLTNQAGYLGGNFGFGYAPRAVLNNWGDLAVGVGGGLAGIPVGKGTIPILDAGYSLPDVVSIPVGNPPFSDVAPIDRRDNSSDTTVVPMKRFQDYVTWEEMRRAGHTLPGDFDVYANPADYVAGRQKPSFRGPAASTPPIVSNPLPPNPNAEEAMWNDLGQLGLDLIRQAGTSYINRELGGSPTQYVQSTPVDFQVPQIDIPYVDVVPQMPSSNCGEMVYKKVCGQYKWVKKQRRRRKRLATKSDLSDLASLKGILGQGKAFEVWIATHS